MGVDPCPPATTRAKSPPPPTSKKDKPVPPTPPLVIRDRDGKRVYNRTGFLGEGGFARVYEVFDELGNRKAVKVVHKASIRTKKNKTKLWAEIKLHQMLKHSNIVRFDDCFEDTENVYMLLELCDNGSLMDLLRRRKRYTEPEARFFLVQLIGACQYMHDNNVIHRDLKLGNLFLDGGMNVKVGDFGLAALIENPGERKKTICGTPNYIAPEVLFDTANGHSFEVDVWSVGIILYTLVIGKPPFQTKDVKAIYRRIRENRYEFPADKEISDSAMDLIKSILHSDPDKRPSLDEIVKHDWFLDGPFPAYVPLSANDESPDFNHLSAAQSKRNYESLLRKVTGKESTTPPSGGRISTLASAVLAQDRDFQQAVQPDSPISALLASARQPLVQGPAAIKEPSLLRKLTAAGAQSTLSPVRRGTTRSAPSSRRPQMGELIEEEDEVQEPEPEPEPRRGYTNGVRDRELASQKARIVSQMAGMKISSKVGLTTPLVSPRRAPLGNAAKMSQPASNPNIPAQSPKPAKVTNLLERCEHNLSEAHRLAATGEGYHPQGVELNPPAPGSFVVSWLDYSAKYGMGFAMSDGTVSVYFNDSSSYALAPGRERFESIEPEGRMGHRRNYPTEGYPTELKTRVYLLHQFENYMMSRLYGDYPYTWVDTGRTRNLVYVERYLRMKNVIVFRLSNDILQFNFYDHTKVVLSSNAHVVSVIDRHHELRTWSLKALYLPLPEDTDAKERRRVEGVLRKVSYARDILGKIRQHGGGLFSHEELVASGPAKATPSDVVKQVSDDRQRVRDRASDRPAPRPIR